MHVHLSVCRLVVVLACLPLVSDPLGSGPTDRPLGSDPLGSDLAAQSFSSTVLVLGHSNLPSDMLLCMLSCMLSCMLPCMLSCMLSCLLL